MKVLKQVDLLQTSAHCSAINSPIRHRIIKKFHILLLTLMIITWPDTGSARLLIDAPHNQQNGIDCDMCHDPLLFESLELQHE
ncbi:hypothetical protein ACFL6N_08005, partial [Thermodesulfobacteriota bacterium]